jgi:hypothetical protein
MVYVGLDHGGVDAHFASLRDTLLVRDAHDSVVDLFDDLGSESPAPAAHGLGVRHFAIRLRAELHFLYFFVHRAGWMGFG